MSSGVRAMLCGLMTGLLMGEPGIGWAEALRPGEPVNGLQLALELVEGQPESFRVHEPVLVRLIILNVGSSVLRVYRGRWTDAPDRAGQAEGILRAAMLDPTDGGSLRRLGGLVHAVDRQVLGDAEVVPPVAPPMGALRKLIELRFPTHGRHDVVLVVTFTEKHYEGHLSPQDMPQAWVGTVMSNPLTIDVVKRKSHGR